VGWNAASADRCGQAWDERVQVGQNLGLLLPKMKVLYMSGYTDNAIVHHGVLEEWVNYIQKPFIVDTLARKVRETLDR